MAKEIRKLRDKELSSYKHAVQVKRQLEDLARKTGNLFPDKSDNESGTALHILSAEQATAMLSRAEENYNDADKALKEAEKSITNKGNSQSATGNYAQLTISDAQWEQLYVHALDLIDVPDSELSEYERHLRDNAKLVSHQLEEVAEHPTLRPYRSSISTANIKIGHRKSMQTDFFGINFSHAFAPLSFIIVIQYFANSPCHSHSNHSSK
jgi:hypothetical protein